MEKIICGQSIKKGQIVEITVPNVEHPIKAVVLDIIEYYIGSNNSHYECIMYAQKRLFKASFEYNWSVAVSYLGELKYYTEVHYYSDLKYGGTIVEYCEIPEIPSDI